MSSQSPAMDKDVLEQMAQKVGTVTIGWPVMPFTDPVGEPYSDTWAVCAVFSIGEPHSNINGPNKIDNQMHIDTWDNLTAGLAPLSDLRLIVVDEVNFDGTDMSTGFLGVTEPMSKLVLIESQFFPGSGSNILALASRLVMHEWGHTQDCFLCGGTYFWGPFTHYSVPVQPAPNTTAIA